MILSQKMITQIFKYLQQGQLKQLFLVMVFGQEEEFVCSQGQLLKKSKSNSENLSNFNLQGFEGMNYLIKQEEILDLKMEDNSDHYLFNSLLALGQIEPHSYLDDDQDNLSFFHKDPSPHPKTIDKDHTDIVINELCSLFNLRVTPLNQLMVYSEQYYGLSQKSKLKLLRALKRQKLSLKRENAKKRLPVSDKSQQSIEQDVKIEDNLPSSFLFEDQSQETKKKKRNRMSAQKSRDRKKEYIKELEKANRDLKKKIEQISSKNIQKLKPASRDFLKTLLCIGITCFLNASPAGNGNQMLESLIQQEKPSSETTSACENLCMDLQSCIKMLSQKHQLLLDEALASLHSSSPTILNDLENNADELRGVDTKQINPKEKDEKGGKNLVFSLKKP